MHLWHYVGGLRYFIGARSGDEMFRCSGKTKYKSWSESEGKKERQTAQVLMSLVKTLGTYIQRTELLKDRNGTIGNRMGGEGGFG